MATLRRTLTCVTFLAVRVASWPHFLLEHDCTKGIALVAGGLRQLPRIMNVIPTEDPTMLQVFAGRDVLGHDESIDLLDGATVTTGAPLTLVYAGVMVPDTQTVFVTSHGLLEGAEPCGSEEGSLLCSSCGAGWLRHATWTPTRSGVAQVAVGFAHGNYGTPAVTVGIRTLHVVEADNATAAGAREGGYSEVRKGDGDAQCGVACTIAASMQRRLCTLVSGERCT